MNNPSKFAKVGQKVKVKIIGLEQDKISLSIKRLKENPWDVLASKYKIGDIIKAPVSRISQFGAFMELDGGIQGLIHLSEIAHGVVKDIRDHIKVGEEIEAKVINFEPNEKRIGLSIKAMTPAPEGLEETPAEGTEEAPKAKKTTKAKKAE